MVTPRWGLLVVGIVVASTGGCARNQGKTANTWSAHAAARYLDDRQDWWSTWRKSARDHDTYCISCHTALPYALSRSSLAPLLDEKRPTEREEALLRNIRKRVSLGKEAAPYYSDGEYGPKVAESHGTESVLNALVLMAYDARSGQMSEDTRIAFAQMWEKQETSGERKGAWKWLQFGLEPWEAEDSPFYGATLAAIALGTTPQEYRTKPEIQGHLEMLREYLRGQAAKQRLANQAALLWAAARWPALLEEADKNAIAKKLLAKQRADGGWSLSSLVGQWEREDGTPLDDRSDGYATGLVCLALLESGVGKDEVHVKAGLQWLNTNQDAEQGSWPGFSLNKRRFSYSDAGRFMGDAATAYAVMALREAEQGEKTASR